MMIFLQELSFTLAVLVLYGFVGGFCVIPFKNNIKYSLLVTPMTGMLVLAMGAFSVYTFFDVSLQFATALTAGFCISLTFLFTYHYQLKFSVKKLRFPIIFLFIFSIFILLMENYYSIKFENLSLLFYGGSDHLGYAGISDWLLSHKVSTPPIGNPSVPSQSFPAVLIGTDPRSTGDQRFGTFFTLAIISLLFKHSSMFTYDVASTIIFISVCLGIAAIYSRTVFLLLCVCFSVLVSLFVISRTGYLGKLIGFPVILYLLGLYCNLQNTKDIHLSKIQFIILLFLTFAGAICYPSIVLASILMVFSFVSIIVYFISDERKNKSYSIIESIGQLVIMAIIAISITTYLSFPHRFDIFKGDFPIDWVPIYLYQFSLRFFYHDPYLIWFTDNIAFYFLMASIFFILVSTFLILKKRNLSASSLFFSAIILSLTPYVFNHKWSAYEFSGLLFPMFMCAYAFSFNKQDDEVIKINYSHLLLQAFIIIAVLMRLPTLIESIHQFVFDMPANMVYSSNEIDALKNKIKDKSVIVDIPNNMFGLPILVELGREDFNLQWTKDSWKNILGYRDWKTPAIKSTNYVLSVSPDVWKLLNLPYKYASGCHLIYSSRQYQLMDCEKSVIKKIV